MKKIIKNFHYSEVQFYSLNEFKHYLSTLDDCIVITEKNVIKLYPDLLKIFKKYLVLSISEHKKNLHLAEKIWQYLMKENVTKQHLVIIIGGGVLHDVAGFACSVFKRGIPYLSVPTTLLSMVDASIGGKNAVNYAFTKNVLGTIYLPVKNIVVPEFLNTLSKLQLLSGWAEIIKIALVKDAKFYNYMMKHIKQSLTPDMKIIQRAIQLKLQIISKDIDDNNERHLLNFGHTIGHAIEGYMEMKKKYIPHGLAVAYGMIAENQIAVKSKILKPEIADHIEKDILQHFSTRHLPEINLSDIGLILQKIYHDKKNTKNQIQFSLIEKIGKGIIKVSAPEEDIKLAVRHLISIREN
ncbi:MAG: 3-dehydroquinate synthase [Bacteroidia bacterium]|nr:MAG: 3-dehydroquinate synthase [Bacteroidia bacterium]